MISAPLRKPLMIRSDDLSADEFGALFTRMFGNLYAHLPRLDRKVVIAGVYGRYEGVSFRRMSYLGDFTTQLPDMDDEITFVFPTAGRIVFALGDDQVGTPRYDLSGFEEKGSELALDVDGIQTTRRSATAAVKATFTPVALSGGWQVVPGIELGYDHALGDHEVESQSHLLGLDIDQRAAFDSRDQFNGAFSLTASLGDLSLGAEVGAIAGGESHGVNGALKASYQF